MARKTEDLTIEVLKQIRDNITDLRGELRGGIAELRGEVAATNTRLDAMEARSTQVELRLATEVIAVAQAVDRVRVALKERLDDHARVDDHERRIAQLERKSA